MASNELDLVYLVRNQARSVDKSLSHTLYVAGTAFNVFRKFEV